MIELVKEVGKNAARLTIFSKFIKKAIANVLLGQIRSFTYIVHLFLLVLPYPVNTQKFFAALFPMVAFDVFPADDWIFGPLLGFDLVESQVINETFDDLGY